MYLLSTELNFQVMNYYAYMVSFSLIPSIYLLFKCFGGISDLKVSIEAVPPPSQWSPGWKMRMQNLDVQTHLSYLDSFVTKTKSIQAEIIWQQVCGGSSAEAEDKLHVVG